ncbi:MAG: hypothetical protein A2351_01210 [Omnitrophica bacterium RIFOXYB12_FULL_50_7]|nr:MAG: hypothetical protein A2351_01210 [Omnitrophica bacterium RIFOXYB12_FULL_50_7]
MNGKEKSLILAFSMQWLIDLFLLISLISLLSIPLARAGETQPGETANDQAQPTVPATTDPVSEKAMTQTLDFYAANDSINFLMESSPLSEGGVAEAAPSVMVPEPPPINNTSPAPVTLEVLQGTVLEEAEEVAMLVSEQCSQSSGAAEGETSCKRTYSNGHHATVLTQNVNEGDELKYQTVIEEFDGDNTLLFRKTIRHRVDYNYLKDQKTKEKELFDIIYQPAGKKTTRELMVYEYFLDTGKAKSLSWTQYKQIADEPKAELVYHALLRYGDDGNPDRGLAERWDHGKRADTFMNWSRSSKGFATLDQETWGQWEGWIQNVSLQAYLP